MPTDTLTYYRTDPNGPLVCLCGDCRWTTAKEKYRSHKTFADADPAWDQCEECNPHPTRT